MTASRTSSTSCRDASSSACAAPESPCIYASAHAAWPFAAFGESGLASTSSNAGTAADPIFASAPAAEARATVSASPSNAATSGCVARESPICARAFPHERRTTGFGQVSRPVKSAGVATGPIAPNAFTSSSRDIPRVSARWRTIS